MLFEKPTRIEEKEEKKEEMKTPKEEGGERIYVMPQEFRQRIKKFGNNFKIPWLIWLIVGLAIASTLGFYFWQKGQRAKVSGAPKIEKPAAKEEKKEEEKSKTVTVKTEIKNDSGEVLFWAELALEEGALEPGKETEIKMEINKAGFETSLSGYRIVAGFFRLSPENLIFKKPGNLKIYYQENQIEKRWENNLTIAYLKEGNLIPLKSTLDLENNFLSIDLDFLPAQDFALSVEESKTIPQTDEMPISPGIPSSQDSDQDGLTDVEEDLYSANKNNPDTDRDGLSDGKEIINLTNPLSKEEGSIVLSGLVSVYTDAVFNYSFFYPTSWIARAIPETENREVMITTNTNEFFTITVVNNEEKLSPLEWYKKQSPGVDGELEETLINGIKALWSPDRLTVYLAGQDKIYAFSYKIGVEREANFKTTFKMMIKSWQFIEKKQLRPDGTLIKYPDQPEVYLIEQNKKRAFRSGEIFEALGYQWENVIEVSVDETYEDGAVISSSATTTPEI